MTALPAMLDLPTVRALFATGAIGPAALMEAVADRIDAGDPAAFISRPSRAGLAQAVADMLARAPDPNSLPLWGIPFAVKDNIDTAGLPTTAACPAYARVPTADAFVVARLRAAGAIMVSKTNLDQFATGLNGTRSPYGAPRCVFDADYISGGSSSGSAVAVAAGLCSFALGTDTAGSGRVPAAFNNIVGIKPTPGLLSTSGVVPACRSLDCVSIFSASVADGAELCDIAAGFDPADPYSRRIEPLAFPAGGLRVGVLTQDDRQFFGDTQTAALYAAAIARLAAMGTTPVAIDFAPFRQTAALLYHGPWVAERLAAFEDSGVARDALDPSVRDIIDAARGMSAVEAFRGDYALATLRRRAEQQMADVDLLLLPTAPTIYRVDEMLAEPIALNTKLGTYTNFFNLLGLCGIAIPAGFRSDGLPAGVTLAAPGGADAALIPIAAKLHAAIGEGLGIDRSAPIPPPPEMKAPDDRLCLAVVGAHLSGMALNHELQALGATLERECRTAPTYRLFLLPDTVPPKPGLVRDQGFAGPGIALEIWSMTAEAFGRFVAAIPAPLGIGRIMMDDGASIPGFLCEAAAIAGAREITSFGGWRAFMAAG